ncbi:MAG: amidase family protein [Bradyrhizobium sp.]|nr:amidase family protein [Bradyrhizobium sp.]
MSVHDYVQRDATALADAVRTGETTAAELLQLALQQSERAQPKTNAICKLMEREARTQLTRLAAGPFAGVPFLIKDCAQDYAGLPTACGSKALSGVVAAEHAHVVRRYIEAGLVIFGKTNLPELALKGVSDSRAFGRVNNPWNAAHVSGGSSGGAAAAVASGVVPMAAGNDGGGSIRIPAACCGLFGLKPSRGRVSSGPGFGEYWYGASSEGVISRGSFSLDLAAKRPMVGKINDMFKAKSGKDFNDYSSRQFMGLIVMADAINRAKSTEGEKIRDALAATDMPGEATIMPWKRVKFDENGQNNDADPVLLQYVGGKFVTIFPTQAAVAEASWPMK